MVTICTTYYIITEIRRLILAVNIDRFLSGRTSLRITYIRFMAGFDLRSAHVRRVVVKVALGQVFVPVLRFSRSVSFHQCYILICIYTLLLAERQTGEAWEPSRKQCASGSREALDRKLSQFSWATLLVADLPPRGHGLYLALFHVGHSGQRVCCMFCGYPLSALFHQCYVLISTSILLSEGRAIEV